MSRRLALVLLLAAAVPAAAGDDPAPTAPEKIAAAKAAQTVAPEVAVETAIRWLLDHQNPDGSWGSHRTARVVNIWCDVPGGHQAFRVATSALCTMSLRGLTPSRRTEATEKAAARGLAALVKAGAVKRAQPAQLYNVWALAYSLRALSEAMLEPREGEDLAGMRRTAEVLVKELVLHQFVEGGWGYFDFRHHTFHPSGSSASFVTGTVLIALHRARAAGLTVPDRVIHKAVVCMRDCRNPDGSWLYSNDHRYWRRGLINRPKGSLSRAPGNATALRLFTGKPGLAEIEKGLDRLVMHHRFALAAVREPTPHRSWYSNSGYFYLYGYAYAVLALEQLPEEKRVEYRAPLIMAVLKTRHPDGCFWDYPLYDYHKQYGTAYALMALDGLLRIPVPESR